MIYSMCIQYEKIKNRVIMSFLIIQVISNFFQRFSYEGSYDNASDRYRFGAKYRYLYHMMYMWR
ncbi:hypothetical protein MTBMA_c08540 [Methanothermobacter marburgensis str. Marburg]|uniref:Uncharacterized protein n=1 Tax=Methanothermobacter marburgensis (strain ATCC BAA-927 / DSM 2133 / JCM 14651 / NBRC 100331 / OCM 82 / Marburg) TaxID=79929 RepID=D9PW51_METTM|nr:hypothetical protein MTBMA_c08540 [Methanothermobacter marburgensis str. Marburg]